MNITPNDILWMLEAFGGEVKVSRLGPLGQKIFEHIDTDPVWNRQLAVDQDDTLMSREAYRKSQEHRLALQAQQERDRKAAQKVREVYAKFASMGFTGRNLESLVETVLGVGADRVIAAIEESRKETTL